MQHRIMVLSEADPNNPGYIRFYYAKIRVEMGDHKHSWVWNQVDQYGQFVGNPRAGFEDMQGAYDDALAQLGGDGWMNPNFLQ